MKLSPKPTFFVCVRIGFRLVPICVHSDPNLSFLGGFEFFFIQSIRFNMRSYSMMSKMKYYFGSE